MRIAQAFVLAALAVGGDVAEVGATPPADTTAPPTQVEADVYVREVLRGPDGLEVALDRGAESQLALGDEVRFACVDDLVGRVSRLSAHESVATLPVGWQGDPCRLTRAQVSLRGARSAPFCPPPPRVRAVRLKVGVVRAEFDGPGAWELTIDKGARDGVALGQAVQLPCARIAGTLRRVDEATSVVVAERSALPEPPGELWINVNDTQGQPFCFHTPASCPAPSAPRDRAEGTR